MVCLICTYCSRGTCPRIDGQAPNIKILRCACSTSSQDLSKYKANGSRSLIVSASRYQIPSLTLMLFLTGIHTSYFNPDAKINGISENCEQISLAQLCQWAVKQLLS